MLRVLWRTGVRVNELLTITPRDVERNNNVINVTKAKGGKQRRVHLDPGRSKCSPNTFRHNNSLMIDPYLPSNSDRCATSSSVMVLSLEKTSTPTHSDILMPV